MVPSTPWFLLTSGLFALPTAIAAAACLPAAAALAASGVLFAVVTRHHHRLAGLAALPALLAAMPARPADPVWPRPGPVRVAGVVAATRHDPAFATMLVHLAAGRQPIRLVCAAPLDAVVGDRITALANLAVPVAPGLSPTLHAGPGAVTVEPAPRSLPRLLHWVRAACERELLRLLPDDRGAILSTLVLGRATRAPRDVADAHRATGLSHLLAVSGAHAAMLGVLLGLGAAGRGRRLATGRRHTLIALLLLFAYAGITGCEPPVVRAVVMYALAALAVQLGRPLGLLAGLLVPALVTALTEPDALTGPSFLLSYAAVFGLSLARHDREGGWNRWFVTPLEASFWATCTTAPLTLMWFGQIAPWTILLTPLLAPLVALLLLTGLLAALLGITAPALSTPFAPLLGGLTDLYVAAVHAADHLPGTPVRALCSPPSWSIAIASLLALCALAGWRHRGGVAAAAVLLAVPWFAPVTPPSAARLRLFAVGHGQACLLETATGRRIAIDCGSLQAPWLAANAIAAALPVRVLDWLVVTHADQDHHNGISALLQKVRIRRALLPPALADGDVGDALRQHGAVVTVLDAGLAVRPCPELIVEAPVLPDGASTNDRSAWCRLVMADTSVLLTGDAESLGTAAAIAQGIALPGDVLVLPHHGRANPSAPALLQTVRPLCCLASAAAADGETRLGELVRRCGADLWVTGLHGDLELRFGLQPTITAGRGERPLRRRQ